MPGFMTFFYKLLYPLEWLISWVMWLWHWVFVTVFRMPDGSSFAWCLAIIFLTFTVRAVIFPLYNKQVRSMAKMQVIQPEMQKIQAKYKGKQDPASREAMTRETMALYKKYGTSPTSSCLPSLVQAPVFMALYNVLYRLANIAAGEEKGIGAFTKKVANEIENTYFFNVKLSAMFTSSDGTARALIVVFVVLMCLTMFLMQWYSMHNNIPRESMQGKQWQMQKMMAFGFPLMYIFSGIVVPFALLLYWLTNNLWTLGQTYWQVNTFPTPGSPAAERKAKRDYQHEQARRKRLGLPSIEEEKVMEAEKEREERQKNGFQRAQPVRKRRKK